MKPEPGWTSVGRVVKVHDADTITVEITRQVNIRLRNVDAYELQTEKGKEAQQRVEELVCGKEVLFFIPSNRPLTLMDFNSFNRLVGDVWIDNMCLADFIKDNDYDAGTKKDN